MAAARVPIHDPQWPPRHPGEVLRSLYVEEGGYSQAELARALDVSRQRLHLILTGMSPISAHMALRLGHVLGTGPKLWLRLQNAYDLWQAEQAFDTSNLQRLWPKES